MSIFAVRLNRWTIPLLGAAVAVLALAFLLAASNARAAELLYWNNYRDEPADTVGFANIDGTGGALLNLSGVQFETTEGMAYDPVTNRIYLAAEGIVPGPNEGEIVYVNLDGSGAGVLSTPGAVAENPEGVALDPATRMIYWINTGNDTVSYAKLDGTGGGTLNTTGAATENIGFRLAIDPVAGVVYFGAHSGVEQVISYARVNNTGGGVLPVTLPNTIQLQGIATDPAAGRLYWTDDSNNTLNSSSLAGGAVTSVALESAFNEGYGLAIDPFLAKAYWGNYGTVNTGVQAFGFSGLGGGSGTINIATTHTNGPQDPVIIKSPSGSGAPQVTQSKAQLSCSQGSWGGDSPGGNVFQSPRSYSYQWSLNGSAISGATASTYTATAPGSYGCTVTATNQAGSAQQSGASSVTVTPAALQLAATKKKAKAKPGKKVTFVVNLANQGDLASAAGKACVKLPSKKAKKALKPQKCAALGALGSGASASVKVGLKVKSNAKPGTYKATITVPGTSGIGVSVKVLAAAKHHKK